MIAYGHDDDGVYNGPVKCQIDPVRSKREGKDAFLLPASSTFTEPPEFDPGTQKAIWDGSAWNVEDIPVSKPVNESAIRIAELKSLLTSTDYQAIKYAEGWISAEDYSPIKAQRQAWRDEINKLEGKK